MFGIDDAIVGTVGAGLVNNLFANSRQEDAQAFSAQQYATRYQTQVKDLQAAGLNPMLAYTQGPGMSPTSSAASSAGMGDVGATINQSRIANAQVANIAADTENKKAQAALIEAQVGETLASAQQKGQAVSESQAYTKKLIEDTENIKVDRVRLEAMIHNLSEHTALLRQQGINAAEIKKQISASIANIKANTKLLDFDIEAAESSGNIGRYSQEFKWLLDIIKTVGGARSHSSNVYHHKVD